MTVFEEWVVEMVKVAVGEMVGDPTGVDPEVYALECNRLEQRVACLLTQARALENRHLAGELMVTYGASQAAKQIASNCLERSHKLEMIALMFAKQWPPEAGELPTCVTCGHVEATHVSHGPMRPCIACAMCPDWNPAPRERAEVIEMPNPGGSVQ